MPDTLEDKQHECLSTTPLPSCSARTAQKNGSDADKKYQHLFEHLIDAAFLADAESGIIIEANDRAADLLGRPREDIIGLHQTALHPPDQQEKYRQIFLRHVEAGTAADMDAEVIRGDGKIIPVLISGSVFCCSGRKLILGIFRDISEKKQGEEQLLLSRFALDTAIEPILWADKNGQVLYVNERACALLGYTAEEALSKNMADFAAGHHAQAWASYWHMLRQHKSFAGEHTYRRPDDTTIPLEIRANYFCFGEKEYLCCCLRDMSQWHAREEKLRNEITRREEIEQTLISQKAELRATADKLEDANRALQVLLEQTQRSQAEMENAVRYNIEKLVMPLIAGLKKATSQKQSREYIDLISGRLQNIASRFAQNLTAKFSLLTPSEIKVAAMIRDGKSSKEIADFMDVSKQTIDFHRKNIRKKLGLKSKKANLRSYLLSLS